MNALGIINFEDNTIEIDGLGEYRPVPAMVFMGRYRIIDIMLSNMTNSGINSVQVYCKEKPRNLIEHLGSGQRYNINSKRGKLRVLYGEKMFSSLVYNTDIENFRLNMQYIERDPNPYVVIAPSYFVYPIDFTTVLKQHLDTNADVTVLYTSTNEAKTSFLNCDTVTVDKEKKITAFGKNRGNTKNRLISLEAYVMRKSLFIDLVEKAANTSSLYWFKDILADSVESLNIRGYQVRGYVACLNTLSEYYRNCMELKHPGISAQLFKADWPIYTQTSDTCPTHFTREGTAKDSVIANGCMIEGEVSGSILGRNVKIERGAIVHNCIIIGENVIGKNVHLENVVVDKYAEVKNIDKLVGTYTEPVYVKRRDRI